MDFSRVPPSPVCTKEHQVSTDYIWPVCANYFLGLQGWGTTFRNSVLGCTNEAMTVMSYSFTYPDA